MGRFSRTLAGLGTFLAIRSWDCLASSFGAPLGIWPSWKSAVAYCIGSIVLLFISNVLKGDPQ